MREIIFRGQTRRKGQKVWMDGTPVDSNWVEGYGVCIGNGDFSVIYAGDSVEKFVVYTDTVGQFTGLTDKNGKKIFEGDIVKCSDVDDCYYTEEKTEFWGVIKFEAGAFGIATKETLMIALGNWCENDNFVSLWELEWNEYIGNVEIIGNIHDNPELLEVEDDG